MTTTAYITHPDCRLHSLGPGHPEQPARLDAINDRLIASGLMTVVAAHEAPLATTQQLAAVHGNAYVEQVIAAAPSPAQELVWLDGDTAMNPHTMTAARRAAGAVILGVDLVLGDPRATRNAFCAVRPPGHHAERHQAMGFCLFNNIAVGAYHALEAHGLSRVAILDFDVHHGNGTEHIVAGDERILMCSSFEHPWYPYTGFPSRADNVISVPLAAGTDSEAFRTAINAQWWPALEAFAPELVLISAGFDAHRSDPLANLRLADEDYGWITAEICRRASTSADGRVVSALEGGYDLAALGRSAEAHVKALVAAE
jgi:acetoin utilization deacetylase AcuC-like enzyme